MKLNKHILKCFSNKIKRKDFNKLTETDFKYFSSILDDNSIERENLDIYNIDWIRKYKGNSQLVLKPKNSLEVSKILAYCNERKLAIVPQGGNTGLVGGSVPVFDEIIVSMSKMNKIIEYEPENKVIKSEAGCILQNLNERLLQYNRIMPIDLGAKGSCHIGGNLSTNAGGIHFIKYGPLRHSCKALKVVIPNGNELYLSTDNEILKQLFVGSEGTLGIITEAHIHTEELYKNKTICIIGMNSFSDLINCYLKAKTHLGQNLSAIEFFDSGCMKMLHDNFCYEPLFDNNPNKYQYYLLIESSTKNDNSFILLADFLNENNLDDKCIISEDSNKHEEIWLYREKVSPACGKRGIVFKYDVSLSLECFSNLLEDIKKRVGNLAVTVGYGHVGDYNLHINVCYDKFIMDETYHKIELILEPYIYDYLRSVKGSISAEHGIGQAKSKYLNRSQTENNISLMKNIKKIFDPRGIMNPYKLFD